MAKMKYHGCILEFTEERNRELMRVFKQLIDESAFIDIAQISQALVNSPCARFWVSEERATVVVQAIIKGKPVLDGMRPTKREMFLEIYQRVMGLRRKCPNETLFNLVLRVVNSPAPKFYMRPRCAMEIIYKIKKGAYGREARTAFPLANHPIVAADTGGLTTPSSADSRLTIRGSSILLKQM